MLSNGFLNEKKRKGCRTNLPRKTTVIHVKVYFICTYIYTEYTILKFMALCKEDFSSNITDADF